MLIGPRMGESANPRIGTPVANGAANGFVIGAGQQPGSQSLKPAAQPGTQPDTNATVGSSGSGRAALASDPRLVTAAHQFEAAMMKELLAPLEQNKGMLGEDDSEDSGSNEALQSFASDALGQALSEHGGIGIATSVLHKLAGTGSRKNGVGGAESVSTGTGNHSGNPAVIGKPNWNTPKTPIQ